MLQTLHVKVIVVCIFQCISNALYRYTVPGFAGLDPININEKVHRKDNIFINEHAIAEMTRRRNANILSRYFRSRRDPDVPDTKPTAYPAGIVDWAIAIAVADDEDIVFEEQLEGGFEGVLDVAGGVDVGDDQSCFDCIVVVRCGGILV